MSHIASSATSHASCDHPSTKVARAACRRAGQTDERPVLTTEDRAAWARKYLESLTPEERKERAGRAGKTRWGGKSEEERKAIMAEVRSHRKQPGASDGT